MKRGIEREFLNHLEEMKKLGDYKFTEDDNPIKDYYVPNYGYLTKIEEWGNKDTRMEGKSWRKTHKVIDLI
jgi:hypothetical protein